jgi:hypothetical protein
MYRISRPANPALAETLGTSSGIRGVLVSAASPAAAVTVANALALARGFNDLFSTTSGWVITDVATTPGACTPTRLWTAISAPCAASGRESEYDPQSGTDRRV